MGFFKSLKNRVRSQVQNPNAPTVNPSPFLGAGRQRLAQMPEFNGIERVRGMQQPQRMPERRMPQQGQSNRFFGGGLESIFERLPQRAPQRAPERRMPPNNRRNFMQMMASNSRAPLSNSMEEQRPMPSMAPMLPMSQEMPERNLLGRLPFQRPRFAAGNEVSSGRRPGTVGPNVQRDMPGRMKNVGQSVTGSSRPPVGSMATPRTGLLPTQTLSRMGTLSRGGIAGLVAAGGLGLFEIGRQTGFDPEKLGQAAAQVQKSLEEVANEAAEVAAELGQPIQDFVGRVVQSYQSEMGGSNPQEILGDSGRTISDADRNLMQQEQMFFPESDPTDQRLNRMFSAGRGTALNLDDMLQDLEKKN